MTIRPFLAGGARWANVALNVFTAIVAVGLLATFVKNQGTSQARSSAIPLEEPASTAIAVPLNADAWQGHRDAPVAMIEFSDFQCPYCGEYARTTYPELKRAFIDTGRLLYAFRNFPLDSVHPLAMPAAAIAACARNRGVLWQVHDGLFALKPLTQQGLDDLAFTNGLAADSGACAREAVLRLIRSGGRFRYAA